MIYEIWDTDSANLLGSFSSESEALSIVRAAVTDHGARRIRLWALTSKDLSSNGRTTTIAKGAQLVERACRMPA
jgi:hypothetical protein